MFLNVHAEKSTAPLGTFGFADTQSQRKKTKTA